MRMLPPEVASPLVSEGPADLCTQLKDCHSVLAAQDSGLNVQLAKALHTNGSEQD
jgi:hypothetical protein